MMRRLLLPLLLVLAVLGSSAQAVYKTPSGKKYHLSSCRMVENVSQKISLAEAQTLGLEPCKICHPESSTIPGETEKQKGESHSVQCKGMTKQGTRCKHMTRIADGYCYQHRPG